MFNGIGADDGMRGNFKADVREVLSDIEKETQGIKSAVSFLYVYNLYPRTQIIAVCTE